MCVSVSVRVSVCLSCHLALATSPDIARRSLTTLDNTNRPLVKFYPISWLFVCQKWPQRRYMAEQNLKISIRSCLPLKVVICWRSSSIEDHLLMKVVFRWMSSSVECCLPLKVVFRWRSSSVEGRLLLMVIFRWSCRSSSIEVCLLSKVLFRQRSSSIKDHLPLKVSFHQFHQRLSSIEGRLTLKVGLCRLRPGTPF